jgi:nucleoside-diphosphate-sugar epimerase
MLPPRLGNRQVSALDTHAIKALGWRAHYTLRDYIQDFIRQASTGA